MRLTEFCELSIAQIEVYIAGRGGIDLLNSSLSVNDFSSIMVDETPDIMKFLGLTGGRRRLTGTKVCKKSNKYNLTHIRLYRHLGSRYYHLELFFSTPLPLFYINVSLFFEKTGEVVEVTAGGENKLLSSINTEIHPSKELDKGMTVADFIKAPGVYNCTT
jgi:hypothetical protein